MDLKKKITSSRYSIKDFSKHIAMYVGREWDDAYYQRIRDILNGDRGSQTADEERAFEYWSYVFDNPFEASLSGYKMRYNERVIDQLWKFIRTGNFNRRQAKRLIHKLKDAIPSPQ